MSYLNALRLHFAGLFQANISSVNNDPAHFYNATFKPEYQQPQGPNMDPPNGWFSPGGDAAFRLLGCKVTTAWMSSGKVTSSDPVLGYIIADSDTQAPAKLVDLDSEQQMASEIWGLQVRIADGGGNTLLRGDFEPAAFIDIWNRALGGGGGDNSYSATFQSVLTNLQWGDVVVLDNLSTHRASRIEEVAEGRGARVLWLPPYSPDYSPIEQCWSKIKSYLRGAKARTGEELNKALAQAIGLVTKTDIRGWFKHCGYSLVRE